MTGVRDITQLCFSLNLAGIVANKIEQSFYSVYFYSGIESVEYVLSYFVLCNYFLCFQHNFICFVLFKYPCNDVSTNINGDLSLFWLEKL